MGLHLPEMGLRSEIDADAGIIAPFSSPRKGEKTLPLTDIKLEVPVFSPLGEIRSIGRGVIQQKTI